MENLESTSGRAGMMPDAPPTLSSWARIPGVLFSPEKTFRDIARRPTWLLALALLVLAGAAFFFAIAPKVDFQEMVRVSMEQQGRSVDGPEMERIMAFSESIAYFGTLAAFVVFQPIGILIVSLLFWMVFKVLGSTIDFRTSVAVTVHSLVPLLVMTLVSIVVTIPREAISLEALQNGSLVMSNLGFLAGEETSPLVAAVLRGIDFFSLWVLVLYVIGFRAATGLKSSTVTAVVVTLWLFWFAIKVAGAAVGAMFRARAGA
jgi:hypothetical protein